MSETNPIATCRNCGASWPSGDTFIDPHSGLCTGCRSTTVNPSRRKSDSVNPAHYKGDYVMRIIEDFKLGFCLGNVVKYVLRADEKGERLQDLKKAAWYLNREIEAVEKAK